jgi:mRNA interferase RelE/StbE
MEKYRVFLRKSAVDELGRIPKKDLVRILERLLSLENDARPQGCEKLSALDRYRVRQGEYRVVYAIDDREKTVDIVKVGHRGDIYKR